MFAGIAPLVAEFQAAVLSVPWALVLVCFSSQLYDTDSHMIEMRSGELAPRYVCQVNFSHVVLCGTLGCAVQIEHFSFASGSCRLSFFLL